MGIVIVGATLRDPFTFEALANGLAGQLGGWAAWMFALGLFAAGLSSTITAPLAAAITAQGLFGSDDRDEWHYRSWRYRSVWLVVLLSGLGFGIAGSSPIPAIILAQALNGVLLPLVSAFLLLVVNDRELLGAEHVNGAGRNALMLVVFATTVLLGTDAVLRALGRALGADAIGPGTTLALAAIVAAVGGTLLWRRSRANRQVKA